MELKAKVTLLGDSEVGKTSLILRYVKNEFTEVYKQTLGADFMTKKIEINGDPNKQITLAIWDLAGQEQFSSLREYYLAGTLAAIICFDLTKKITFEHVPAWMQETRNICGDIPIILVGTKNDLEDRRRVSKKEVETFTEKDISKKVKFFETSSALHHNVNEAFQYIVDSYIQTEFPG